MKKHPSTLWFKASTRTKNGIVQFKYTDIEFSRAPQIYDISFPYKNRNYHI